MDLKDILAALGVLLDSLPQGLLAMSFGFAALPSAIGFGIGAIFSLLWQLPTPISFQAETTIAAGGLGRNVQERISIIVFAGIAMVILGITGTIEAIVNFIGTDILYGMLAGVGIILVKASIDLLKTNLPGGITSFAVAIPVYLLTESLIYACVFSVIVGTVIYHIYNYIQKNRGKEIELASYDTVEKFKLVKLLTNFRIVRGALAIITLQIGGNITYGTITAGMSGSTVDLDKLSIVGGLATTASGMFGGAPLASIISATGESPNPVTSGVLLMALAAIIIGSTLFYKFGKLVPVSAVGGFLFVLGATVVFPTYGVLAMDAENPVVSGVTTVVTAVTDPFLGMVAGVLVRAFLAIFGL
ncbi:MAG TPA: NCS2 family permease [Bacillota bacterium]|nr:NCS2 family permease [Bacillota bacterium]